MKVIITTVILLLCIQGKSFAQNSSDTIKLYFDIGVPHLDMKTKARLDSAIYFNTIQPGKKLAILGYADYLGSDNSNQILSEHRANNVKEYLEGMGISASEIQMVVGKGEVSRQLDKKGGYASDRRVDIIQGWVTTKNSIKKSNNTTSLDREILKPNQAIRLNNIYFFPGSHKIKPESEPELQKLVNTMYANPTLEIQIEGHICCLPASNFDGYDYDSQDFNLSRNRAKAVYDHLIQRRISKSRLRYVGYGKSRPIVSPEKTEKDENINRRVEIRVINI